MVNIYINMHRGTGSDVEVHREDCTEARKILKHGAGDDAGEAPHVTPVEIWEEYNVDFIQESLGMGYPAGQLAWNVDIYPCTGLVKTRTTVTDYPES